MDELTTDEIIAIHSRIIEQRGGDGRMLSEAGLHQIVFNVNLSADAFHKAAYVFFSFCAYPPFREENARTALCIVKNILDREGYRIDPDPTELAKLVRGVESFSLEIEELEGWLHRHAKRTSGS